MDNSTPMAATFGACVGALIWIFSPYFSGYVEPWGGSGGYYLVALLVAGILSGVAIPRRSTMLYFGAVAGQMAYILAVPHSAVLEPLTVSILLACTLILLAGSAFGAQVERIYK
jgi:hypothetical protein